ncbi:MAG: hypothetical protein HWN66_11055 [Candidatus Helarchaeota archaeon]|nr:hypothetical protein [Candidatus Helarchaeota archaeon]
MVKGKIAKKKAAKNSINIQSDSDTNIANIFKFGMNFENTIEFIESKILDAFFGHISRQGDWDLAEQYILNVQEWCQMLQTTVKIELDFLPKNLQQKIIATTEKLGVGIENMLEAISKKDFDEANKVLEPILKEIRALYKIRE